MCLSPDLTYCSTNRFTDASCSIFGHRCLPYTCRSPPGHNSPTDPSVPPACLTPGLREPDCHVRNSTKSSKSLQLSRYLLPGVCLRQYLPPWNEKCFDLFYRFVGEHAVHAVRVQQSCLARQLLIGLSKRGTCGGALRGHRDRVRCLSLLRITMRIPSACTLPRTKRIANNRYFLTTNCPPMLSFHGLPCH